MRWSALSVDQLGCRIGLPFYLSLGVWITSWEHSEDWTSTSKQQDSCTRQEHKRIRWGNRCFSQLLLSYAELFNRTAHKQLLIGNKSNSEHLTRAQRDSDTSTTISSENRTREEWTEGIKLHLGFGKSLQRLILVWTSRIFGVWAS